MPIASSGLRRWLRRESVTVKASGAETSSTTGAAIELGDARALSFTLAVTAVSGTSPTMTVRIEGSDDATSWFTLATIGANGYSLGSLGTAPSNITGTATVRGACHVARYIRYVSTIGGTSPSFTYSLSGQAS